MIRGYNKVSGSHLILRRLRFLGPTGPVDARSASDPRGEDVPLWLAGSQLSLVDSDVANSLWHAGVYVDGDSDRLIRDRVYHNGDFGNASQSNVDQGIYWAGGHGGSIRDTIVAGNLANGVQLYPDAEHVTVERDTIVDNGKSGVIVGAGSAGNVIVNDIVTGNRQNGVRSFDLAGSGNVAVNNIIWGNAEGNSGAAIAGLSLRATIHLAPGFVTAGDYQLRSGSPALGRAVDLPGQSDASSPLALAPVSRGGNVGAYQGPGVVPGGG